MMKEKKTRSLYLYIKTHYEHVWQENDFHILFLCKQAKREVKGKSLNGCVSTF